MKIIKIVLMAVLIITMSTPQVAHAMPIEASEKVNSNTSVTRSRTKRGWVDEKGRFRYYLNNGTYPKRQWRLINKRWFYFNKNGHAVTGWRKIGGKTYYLRKTGSLGVRGRMLVGWHKLDGKNYYFAKSGEHIPGRKKGAKVVAIDPGHQRRADYSTEVIGPGSSKKKPRVSTGTYGRWSRLNEYQLNLTVSKKLERELKKRGYNVYMIRTTHDVNISNSQRAKNAANAGADIFVRVHANGDRNSAVAGALTMAPGNNNPFLTKQNIARSRKLSSDIIGEFCKATGARNRGVHSHNDMTGINWSTIPVTIVEMGYMSNQADDLNMANARYQNRMVTGMANGIDRYFKKR